MKLQDESQSEYGELEMTKSRYFSTEWDLGILTAYSHDPEIDKQLKGLGRQMLCTAVNIIKQMYPNHSYGTIKLEAGGILGLPSWKISRSNKLIEYYESFGFKKTGYSDTEMRGDY